MTKDYYRILGVLDDAEDVVIRAAYKALDTSVTIGRTRGTVAHASSNVLL